ncbi:MAG: hypothetical protein IT175_13225 [Acidobacteria bacterium]|nr:hypothetical protein [Acidobacteriota bacterium]
MTALPTPPPLRLSIAVGGIASAMLLVEIVVTRLFSVLFYYHFSFFAVSLVMSGLVIGGLLAARIDVREEPETAFFGRLARLGIAFALAIGVSLVVLCVMSRFIMGEEPSLWTVAICGLAFLPGLVAAGAFLAAAFARNRNWIGTLYAWDLVAAAAACISAIGLLRLIQGPVVLLAPVLLAAAGALAIAGTRRQRLGSGTIAAAAIAAIAVSISFGPGPLRFTPDESTVPLLERWNEHSRIAAMDVGDAGRYLVIDRSASTLMRPLPPGPGGAPPVPDESWANGVQYPVYATGRHVERVAIIGVGGGIDLLPPIWHGASRVDGYELNATFIDLLQDDFRDYNAIASRPEVSLHHGEARVSIARSGQTYDVIQASLIDTWAATASGGFVLSENGLYTREGWRTFLSHLTASGVLTMTRWYLDDAPAETHRLVSLAAVALADAGIADPRGHVVLIRTTRYATILVSKTAFETVELERLKEWCGANAGLVLAGPGVTSTDPVLDRLLDPATCQTAIGASAFNIAPPDDVRPYFFLQVRPMDLFRPASTDLGGIREITFNGVRVMLILAACSAILAIAVLSVAIFGLPGSSSTPAERRRYRLMSVYFFGIGFGYILVQLGLHQRLIIVLGHPTLALSVVLFAMLLGTGIGAGLSNRIVGENRIGGAACVVLGTLAVLWAVFPTLGHLEALGSAAATIAIAGSLVAVAGGVLGLAFPLGVRLVAPTGEWAVQKMWAINGAASIAASVAASLAGVTMGSRAVVTLGLSSYALAFAAALVAGHTSVEVAPSRTVAET